MLEKKLSSHRTILLGTLCLSCLLVGCASVFDGSSNRNPKKKKEGWSWFKKPEYQEPKSMVAIWTEDTLVQPGKPVTRGFGGRLYFYNEKSQAIPVDGEFVVYGFDDSAIVSMPSASPSDKEIPAGAKKFVFTPEQFTQHFSHSDLGASYSVWIPWDAVGGDQKKITLMPTFINKDKRLVRGDSTKLTLSGKTSNLAANQTPNNAIQLASATIPTVQSGTLPRLSPSTPGNSAEPAIHTNNSSMKTTTIKMEQPIHPSLPNGTQAVEQSALSSEAKRQIQATLTQLQQSTVQPVVPINANVGNNLNQMALPPLGHNIPPTGWVQPSPTLGLPASTLIGSQQNLSPTPGLSNVPQNGHPLPSSLRQ